MAEAIMETCYFQYHSWVNLLFGAAMMIYVSEFLSKLYINGSMQGCSISNADSLEISVLH